MAGPLSGLKVIEFAGIGPGPFCAMLLADLGADVLRVARPGAVHDPHDVLARGRTVLELDLRGPGAVEQALAAGHDINYIAISGALNAIGRAGEAPVPPMNYVGDFGGGAMLLAVGVLGALFEAGRSGRGQVVDAAMTDGAALLSAMMYGFKAAGQWNNRRGENMLDGGAFFYSTYACADGRYVAVGAIEPQFYALLREHCGIALDPAFDPQMDRDKWPLLRQRLAEVFRTRTCAEWCALLEGSDACFAPVLDWDEAPMHRHNLARRTFVTVDGVVQPAPAPRFDRTPADVPRASRPGSAASVLARWADSAHRPSPNPASD